MAGNVMSLPMHPYIEIDNQQYIVSAIMERGNW